MHDTRARMCICYIRDEGIGDMSAKPRAAEVRHWNRSSNFIQQNGIFKHFFLQ